MIRKMMVVFLGIVMHLLGTGQNKDDILMKVGGTDVTVGEFKYIYEKNNGAQVLAAGGLHGKSLVFSGGTPDSAQIAKASNATWSIDLDTLQFISLEPFPGPPFLTAASTMDPSGRLFVFGGGTWDEKTQTVLNLDVAHAFDVKKNTWKKLRSLPYAARGMSAVVVYQAEPKGGSLVKSFVYLAGGYKNDTEGFTDEAFLYDVAKDEYRPAIALPYKAMVALVVLEGHLYCLGGEDKKQSRTDACYRISIDELP